MLLSPDYRLSAAIAPRQSHSLQNAANGTVFALLLQGKRIDFNAIFAVHQPSPALSPELTGPRETSRVSRGQQHGPQGRTNTAFADTKKARPVAQTGRF
jgi:hypothetical protein